MGEIEIKLRIGQQPESIYRFSNFPVEIGRSSDCQLSICHEAIARRLCRVWIEPNGQIHVEEHAALTNSIFENGKRVQGGICKARLMLSIGPVSIDIRNPAALPHSQKRGRICKSRVVIAALAVTVVLLLLSWQRHRNATDRHTSMVSAFPRSVPIEPPISVQKSDVPTDVLAQLAQTEFMRLPDDVHRKKRAIQLIWRAEKSSPSQSPEVRRCHAIRLAWTAELDKAYRHTVVTLLNGLKNEDRVAVQQSAGQLQHFLDGKNERLVSWLKQLEKNGGEQ